jgi:DNA-directed RNA polymerase subunit RPC12/RpoP
MSICMLLGYVVCTERKDSRMTMEVTCRRCEQRFEPTSESIRRGDWQVCPACRQELAVRDAKTIMRRLEVAAQDEPSPPEAA